MIDPEKTEAIRNYPRPKTLRQLRRFLGMTSWYRKFIERYAILVDALTRLTKKDVKFKWGEEQEIAFQEVKERICEAPVLHRPVPDVPFTIEVDACNSGLGSVITTTIDGKQRVIAWASRALTKDELKYNTSEKECLAIRWSIEKFRPYVEGDTFTIISDHSALKWLFSKKNPTGRLGRWVYELMEYDFKVIHRKGAQNIVPDALSRMFEDDSQVAKISAVDIAKETTDPWYKKRVYQILKHPKRYRAWNIIEGKIYRYRPDETIDDIVKDLDAWKLVIPQEKRVDILYEMHNEPSAGHMGVEKTYRKIAQYYYWPGMYRDIISYVRGCQTCQKCKLEQRGQIGLMGTRETTKPWQAIAADLIGELPRSKAGFEYLLIFEDLFSRIIICIPIKRKTGAIVKNALENQV